MRNKGAILTLAIALTLVCLYQLSFTWKATSIRKNLDRIAKQDQIKIDYLADSLKGMPVYNLVLKNFTYKEVQERELNFGLDLKGGMNVILEISTIDVVKALAHNSQDSIFNLALKNAAIRRDKNEGNFLTLFGEEFSKLDPYARLSAIFNSAELRDKISYNTSNEEVLKVISKETQGAIDNAFNIIRTRIDQFGVSQPNIQKLESGDRILVELPGVKDKERVRKLLQGTANLEFWETYDNAEMIESLNKANEIIYNYEKTQKDLQKSAVTPVSSTSSTAITSTTDEKKDKELSLVEKIKEDTTQIQSASADEKDNKFPLFSILIPLIDRETGQPYPGAIIGHAHYKDTTKINAYIRIAKERNILPRDAKFLWSALPVRDPKTHQSSEIFELYAIKIKSRDGKAPLDGGAIVTASQEFDQAQGSAYVMMSMNGDGSKKWARITKENLGKVICIVLDDKVFSGPTVQSEINGGSSQITGNFTVNEAQDLANLLKSGTLPAPARIVQEDVVGPTLGSESIRAGLISFIMAFIGVLLYMWLYYGRAGNVANIALFANVVFLFGVFASMGLVLTLPGIAGIVLTLAMAVDGNVIIYERMREETRAGKSPRMVVKDGFWHAYSAIIDGHVTTILTGVVLFLFGSGPVQGFAVSLIVGLLLSLFSSIFIARLCFEWMLDRNMHITLGNKYTLNTFSKANIDFIGVRKIMYVVSATIMIIGVISLFVRGLDPSIDFKGGRTYIVNFDKAVTTAEIRTSLTKTFGSAPEVKTIGSDERVKITTAYLIDDKSAKTDSIVEHKLYEGVKSHFVTPISYTDFSGKGTAKHLGVLSSQKVDPAISNELIYKAFMAVFFGLIIIFVYIAIRFKNWKYGMGGVISLFHDSMVVITMFSLFWGRLPFSLEIDQTFIAAILTVIGYSIMDSVIIFDRIREYKKLYPQRPLDEVINIGINHTLGRTINTSGITFVTLLVIFIFGGDILRGFIFALIVGVVIGTYSSVFNATPIAYDIIMASEKKKKK